VFTGIQFNDELIDRRVDPVDRSTAVTSTQLLALHRHSVGAKVSCNTIDLPICVVAYIFGISSV